MPFGNGPFVAIPRTIRIGVILHVGYVLVFKYLGASNPQLLVKILVVKWTI